LTATNAERKTAKGFKEAVYFVMMSYMFEEDFTTTHERAHGQNTAWLGNAAPDREARFLARGYMLK
jgi:hypothetical protein